MGAQDTADAINRAIVDHGIREWHAYAENGRVTLRRQHLRGAHEVTSVAAALSFIETAAVKAARDKEESERIDRETVTAPTKGPIPARYIGTCPECGGTIDPGDLIATHCQTGQWVHDRCAED